ncbi:nuclear factor Y, subunit B12 [Actinidia rufa]|uniref:Nuclear factor Y, subunit B12 n=1 Tax=Actinidia rufa TaxID=165716 RepID=A0A7J0GA28_9ERIC|nr:nuclear factor Y, subunit B12 [Actinidia rufa]
MTKIIKEMLPPDVRVARDAQDLLIECCVGWLWSLIGSVVDIKMVRCYQRDKVRVKATLGGRRENLVEENQILDACYRDNVFFRKVEGVGGPIDTERERSHEHSSFFFYAFTEFINLISSESNEVCSKEEKKTIAPEHVLKALEVLGFGEYMEDVYAAYEQHRLETMDSLKGAKWSNVAEMTEEEALAEQQRMFAEARARMNGGVTTPKQTDPEATVAKQSEPEPSMNS